MGDAASMAFSRDHRSTVDATGELRHSATNAPSARGDLNEEAEFWRDKRGDCSGVDPIDDSTARWRLLSAGQTKTTGPFSPVGV